MLRSLLKRTRDVDESDGRWKNDDKWKIKFQMKKIGKIRVTKFEGENENEKGNL